MNIDFGSKEYTVSEEAAEQGVQYIFRDPKTDEELYTEDGKPVCVWVLGKDSKEFHNYQSEQYSKMRGKKKDPTFEQAKAMTYSLLARLSVKFENVSFKGEPVTTSHASASKFYKECAWAREQVDEFISDRSNFLGN